MTTPLEQAQAILGEHYRNYVIIAQPEEYPHTFEFVCSDSFATTGLLMESMKYHDAVMNTFQPLEEAFEWLEEEEEASDEEEDWL
tara:strand:+ start:217 stop:471 length:255 start_codon:yes stop_codon:yes gene_type:complete